jgi:hypothetical protein
MSLPVAGEHIRKSAKQGTSTSRQIEVAHRTALAEWPSMNSCGVITKDNGISIHLLIAGCGRTFHYHNRNDSND